MENNPNRPNRLTYSEFALEITPDKPEKAPLGVFLNLVLLCVPILHIWAFHRIFNLFFLKAKINTVAGDYGPKRNRERPYLPLSQEERDFNKKWFIILMAASVVTVIPVVMLLYLGFIGIITSLVTSNNMNKKAQQDAAKQAEENARKRAEQRKEAEEEARKRDQQRKEAEQKAERAAEQEVRKQAIITAYDNNNFEEVLRIDKTDIELDANLLQILAIAHVVAGDSSKVAGLYDEAIQKTPYKRIVRENKAKTLIIMGEYKQAIAFIQQNYDDQLLDELTRDGRFDILASLMEGFIGLGRTDNAIDVGKKYAKRKKVTPNFLYVLGAAYEAKKDKTSLKQALKYYNQVLSLDISHKDIEDRINVVERLLEGNNQAPTNNSSTDDIRKRIKDLAVAATISTTKKKLPQTENNDHKSFIAIDFETATKQKHSACALGIAVVEDGQIIDAKRWLIKPVPLQFNQFNIDIHGLDKESVRNEKTFAELWPEISDYFSGEYLLVAHYAPFDMEVLAETAIKQGITLPDNLRCIDTVAVARRAWPMFYNHKLPTVCDELDIPLQHHEPESDARAAANILLRAMEKVNANTLTNLMRKIPGSTTYLP